MIKAQQVSDKVGSVSVVNSGADDLLAKIRALSKINAELLERIASRMGAQVIIRYDYSVTLNYCAGATDPVQISIAEVTESARVRVNSWKYTGEPLDRVWVCCGPSDRENINRKKFWKYSDLNEVNKNLLKLSERFASIAGDNEKVRDILRGYLNNFEKIQVAIGQVEELTIDTVDDFNQNELQKNLKAVVSTMKLFPRDNRFTLTASRAPLLTTHEMEVEQNLETYICTPLLTTHEKWTEEDLEIYMNAHCNRTTHNRRRGR